MNNEEKKIKLSELISDLSDPTFKDTNKTDYWIQILCEIYQKDFRHSYSYIFVELQKLLENKNEDIIEALGENLNLLDGKIDDKIVTSNYIDKNLEDTAKAYKKFSDHIKLEIGRYNFIQKELTEYAKKSDITSIGNEFPKELKEKIDNNADRVDRMQPVLTDAKRSLEEIDDKLRENQSLSITVLTIFAAVVLAFSGGITFEAGVFKGIADASAYRLVFIVALTGMILFNTIFCLLYIIGKITNKDISAQCKYNCKNRIETDKCGDGFCKKPFANISFICKVLHKYLYVFFVNITFFLIMYTDFILWMNQFKNNWIIIFYFLVLPLLLISTTLFFISSINKMIQIKRFKLNYKLNLLSKYLYPSKQNIYDKLRIFNIFSSDDEQKNFNSFIEENLNEPFQNLLQKINIYIEQNINYVGNKITWYKHHGNKKLWNTYSKCLQEKLEVLEASE